MFSGGMSAGTTVATGTVDSAEDMRQLYLPSGGYARDKALYLSSLAYECGRHDHCVAVMTHMLREESEVVRRARETPHRPDSDNGAGATTVDMPSGFLYFNNSGLSSADVAVAQKALATSAERHVFEAGVKACIQPRRGALRLLSQVTTAEQMPEKLVWAGKYAQVLEDQLLSIVDAVIKTLAETQLQLCDDLITSVSREAAATSAGPARDCVEACVSWYKLCADVCRYATECVADPTAAGDYSDRALSYYSKARQIAISYLPASSPLVLGVNLNFCVFLFETRSCEMEAIDIATQTLTEAELATTDCGDTAQPEELSEEAAAVCTLLAQNVTLWQQLTEAAQARL